jgi:glycosyltransferase involved in cell wall biosynthesis
MDLSVLIPARNEEFLFRTIQDVLEHSKAETEIIAILDGYLTNPPLNPDPRVTVIYNPIAVGQRGAANQAAKIAKGKYVMKIDAHVALDDGFDVKMLDAFKKVGDNVTMIPVMRNLHCFDWVCAEGHRRYQSPSGSCETCGKLTIKDIVWYPKPSPTTHSFRFDKTMHFQYWGDWSKKPEVQKGIEINGVYDPDLRESMSIQGSCFMLTKKKYFELDICSEDFNSWGQQGVEVACKTWLSGGRVIVNMKTWYAHMFRTRGGDFGFPYHNPQNKVNENRELSRELFQRDKWPQAIRKFQWILDKFNPPDWQVNDKGIIYYTSSDLDEKIAKPVRDKLQQISDEKKIPIVSASLKRMNFGIKNIRFPSFKKGYLALFKQILGALENSKADIIFFTEHDVLYHPSHFDFTPSDKKTFYYNQNVWFLRPDGHALHYDVNQLSGMCGYRDALLTHFRERFALAEQKSKELSEGEFNSWVRHMGFEPFTHGRVKWQNQFEFGSWKSEFPNIDIRFGVNPTGMRWNKEQYRNQQLLINWTESTIDQLPGWDINDLNFIKQL